MPQDALEKALERSIKKEPNHAKLNALQSDVWQKIHEEQEKMPWALSLFAPSSWGNARLLHACFALILVCTFIISQLAYPHSQKKTALGLEFFSPKAPYLLTTMLEQQDINPS